MTKFEKLKHCIGCEQNFYNGNNSIGVLGCWSLESAKLVKRVRVGMWERPPYNPERTIEVFDCRQEKGNVLVKAEALTKGGFWR